MHKEANDFIESMIIKFPEAFEHRNVLDVGSLDINGNNRKYFNHCKYTGLDIGPGRNVDIVCPIHLFESESKFETIISTEMLEHDIHWKSSLLKMIELLDDEGSILITCAGINREEHGTTRTSPIDSPFTNDYYKNISKKMLLSVFKGKFKQLIIEETEDKKDIYLFANVKEVR